MRTLLILIGALAGAGATAIVISMNEEPDKARRASARNPALARALETVDELRAENAALRTELEQQRRQASKHAAAAKSTEAARDEQPHKAPVAEGSLEPLSAAQINEAIEAFSGRFQSTLVGTERGKRAVKELREALARAEPGVIQGLIDEFGDASKDMGRRLMLAHTLGHSADPVAITALKSALQDPEAGLMVHRFASHGLAFSDAPDLDPFLMEMAEKAADTGVRANSAFGLQRRGVDKGIELYFAATDEAFKKGDPAALQYLGGVALMSDKALPLVRERLSTYKDEQARLVLISVIQSKGDMQAIPALEAITQDANAPASLRRAAEGALKALEESRGE